jgi:ketosteroid isomerase-like protein
MTQRFLSTIVAVVVTITAVAAQGAGSVRAEVQQFVKSYIDAQNKPDATAVMDMVSRKPGVSSIGMGKITRGWEAIRGSVDEDVGSPTNPKMILGVIDVEPLGNTYALAVAPFSATLSTPRGDIQVHGAITLVVGKVGGSWKVLHEHTSVQIPTSPQGD